MAQAAAVLSSLDMQFFRLHIAYDGSAFCGFQAQDNGRTVESELQKALFAVTGQMINLHVAGRTDAGVHAAGQVVSCAFVTTIKPRNLTLALFTKLPHDISVWRIDSMPEGFDARRQSIGKLYTYRLDQSLVPHINWRKRAWHMKKPLDSAAMQEAARYLVGEHDFSSFRSVHCEAAHAVRYIWDISVEERAPLIEVRIKGNAFCLNMVRIIVGTLVEVGQGKRKPEALYEVLKARDRKQAGITAKAHGLTLERIYYPDQLHDAEIPEDARFPRYPVSLSSWPIDNDAIAYG